MSTAVEEFSGFVGEAERTLVRSATLVAAQICRQYRLYGGPKWVDAGTTETPNEVTVHISELEGVSDHDHMVRFGRFDKMVESGVRNQDLVLVKITMEARGSWHQPKIYTGDVIVSAKPLVHH